MIARKEKKWEHRLQMRMMKVRRLFTLLEMMVVLAILSIIGALTTVHIKKLVDAHRFESEVSGLFIAIQEAQVLSAAFQTDLSLDFFQKKGSLYYRISTDEPFSSKQLNQADFPLAHTVALCFNPGTTVGSVNLPPPTAISRFEDTKVRKFHLDIFSGGRIEPGGILTFRQTQEEDAKELWFDLQHGHLPKFTYHKPSPSKQQIPAKPKEL